MCAAWVWGVNEALKHIGLGPQHRMCTRAATAADLFKLRGKKSKPKRSSVKRLEQRGARLLSKGSTAPLCPVRLANPF